MKTAMDVVAQFVCDSMRASLAAMPEHSRTAVLEMTLNAMARLCVEHQAPAAVAANLRALAEAIESG